MTSDGDPVEVYRSDSSSPTSPTHCRYKTGRCMNARVVKPNGTRLLLCEFHRSQQNRTKKRSDMKYRHDRARKRRIERRQHQHQPGHTDQNQDEEVPARPHGQQCKRRSKSYRAQESRPYLPFSIRTASDLHDSPFRPETPSKIVFPLPRINACIDADVIDIMDPMVDPMPLDPDPRRNRLERRDRHDEQRWHPEDMHLLAYFLL